MEKIYTWRCIGLIRVMRNNKEGIGVSKRFEIERTMELRGGGRENELVEELC